MATKAKYKAIAANDNRVIKPKWPRTEKLRGLKSQVLKAAPKTSIATDTRIEHLTAAPISPHAAQPPSAFETRKPEVQAIFLLVLGFALTCIAAWLYIAVTQTHSALLNLLIPAIMISAAFLIAMRSSITLWISLIALMIWSGLGAIAKFNGLPIPASHWLVALPILLSLQIIAASHSTSRLIMLASLTCAYLWLAIFTLGSELNALASGTLVFILGTAHHRLGKTWGDKGINYSHEHTVIGWVAAITGLIWAQHYFIAFGEIGINTVGLGAAQSFYWIFGVGLALTVIILSSLIRIRHNRLSVLGFLHICASCIIMPVLAYNPPIVLGVFESFSGLPATPYFGFALGAVVLALAISLGMNGLRRQRYVDTLIAGLTICAQAAIIVNPSYFNFDTVVVVMFGMIFALCFELIIAQRSIITSGPRIRT